MTLDEEIQQASWMVDWKMQAWSQCDPEREAACWHDYQAAVERRNALLIEAGVDPLTEPFRLPWLKSNAEVATA